MEMRIKYNNDTPPFEASLPVIKGWDVPIIELKVEGTSGRSRRVALNDYVVNLQSGFRELLNKHETNIEELEIQGLTYLNFCKTKDDVTVGAKKYNVILFNIYKDFFNEQLYFTRNSDIIPTVLDVGSIKSPKRKSNLYFEENLINQELLDPKTAISRFIVDSLLSILTFYLPNYSIKVNMTTKKIDYTYKGTVLGSIEDIKDDDVFVFFKLFEVIFNRGSHLGVFFIDCEFLSTSVIKAICALVNLCYLDKRLMFLFNISPQQSIGLKDLDREVVLLPNQKIPTKI